MSSDRINTRSVRTSVQVRARAGAQSPQVRFAGVPLLTRPGAENAPAGSLVPPRYPNSPQATSQSCGNAVFCYGNSNLGSIGTEQP